MEDYRPEQNNQTPSNGAEQPPVAQPPAQPLPPQAGFQPQAGSPYVPPAAGGVPPTNGTPPIGGGVPPYGGVQPPAYPQPVVYPAPVYQVPVYQVPVYQTPIYPPIYQTPVYPQAVEPLPVGFCPPAYEEGALTEAAEPLLVTMGRPLIPAQVKRLRGARRTTKNLLFAAFTVLFVFFGLSAYGSIAALEDEVALIAAFAALLAAFVSGLVGRLVHSARSNREDRQDWSALYAARGEQCVLTLYTDRAQAQTPHGDRIVRLADASLWEYADMLVLTDADSRIVWRAADLTAQDARFLLGQLYRRIPDERRHFSEHLQAQLTQPLPLSAVERREAVIAAVTYTEKTERRLGRRVAQAVPFLFSASVAAGLQLAGVLYLTDSLLLDMLLFCLMVFAGSLALTFVLLLTMSKSGQRTVSLRFTRGGLETQVDGDLRYYPAQAVQVRPQEGQSLQLTVPGDRFLIPWSAVADDPAVKALLGLN